MAENVLLSVFGIVISCLINGIVIFQFMEDRYVRSYHNKSGYIALQIVSCVILMLVNAVKIPILNMLSWIGVFGSIAVFFYTENRKNILQRILEIVGLILVLSICETVGYLIFEFILWKFNINTISSAMHQCLHMTFSKLVIIVFYYLGISRIWKFRKQTGYTATQYAVYIVMIVYSIANLSVVIFVVSKDMAVSFTERVLLLINMFCIVFADLFFIYVTKFTEENGQLKLKLRLLEQQSNLQYEYYADQEEKHKECVKILHDVNKHLNMMKEIYKLNRAEEAYEYATEIGRILTPLVLLNYTSNPILNIILNDKKRYASLHEINMKLDIEDVDLGFMEPMEVTTIFANLLDNAVEACDAVQGKEKYIVIKLSTYNDFIGIHISNTSKHIPKWIDGKPESDKGKNHGIGLWNVENIVERYNGSMLLDEYAGIFTCNIIFNS